MSARPIRELRVVPAPTSARLDALDHLRGLVMVLMTLDHASGEFNAGRLMTDGVALYTPGMPLPTAQFLTRWVTHLCAPTFVFLAGTALALSIGRRRAVGHAEQAIDRFLITRGAFIAALDPLWMSWVFFPGRVLLQVLYAIGGGLAAMAALRRLDPRWLLGLALVLVVGGEALTGLALALGGSGEPTLPAALLVTGGSFGRLIVGYPLLPWLAMMLLGWCFGRWLERAGPAAAPRLLVRAGIGALVVFVAVRGLNGYGNMLLPRESGSLVQWLHVSKYPPSLSFVALELGLMALVLAALFRAERTRPGALPRPLLVLGQTALFYYLLHVHVLALAAWALGLQHRAGLVASYVATAATLVVLYPLCVRYAHYKRAHPDGWTRYV
jgi:uncharacterized membrane protein